MLGKQRQVLLLPRSIVIDIISNDYKVIVGDNMTKASKTLKPERFSQNVNIVMLDFSFL